MRFSRDHMGRAVRLAVREWGRTIVLVLAVSLLAGCRGPIKELRVDVPLTRDVYVVHRGLHAGIVVEAKDLPEGAVLPPQAEGKRYVELGWGDREGYPKDWTTRIVLRALFLPTPSVLLVRGFDEEMDVDFGSVARSIVKVELSDRGFEELWKWAESYYVLDAQGDPKLVQEPFYESKGKYHLFSNSNRWTARALRKAGCPITPAYGLTARNVMFQSRRFGEVFWEAD